MAGETRRETIHVEGLQVTERARVDVGFGNVAQLADITNVFHDAKVEIETEGLREVAGLRTGFARGLAKDVRSALSGFHHAGEDLKGGGFAGTVGADQSENFAAVDFKADAAHGFEGDVALPQIAHDDNGGVGGRVSCLQCAAIGDGSAHCARLCLGQVVPLTRISPSAGMPGLA